MEIKFCGAVDCVTGSCHLLTTESAKVLLDCGQFQGNKHLEARNEEEFPFNPADIDYMILSHAHVDHCGRIPLLVKRGFRGQIYCTKATADLLEVMLRDCAHIQEKDAEWDNRKARRAGRPEREPIYTMEDAEEALKYIVPVLYDQLIELNDKIKICFNDAGHILGSAITEIWVEENGVTSKIVFSGDIGVMERPILRDPVIIKKADYVIMETTYGNRLHEQNQESVEKLMQIIVDTVKRGGNVVIPSFAVGRTQELIFQLNKYYESNNQYRPVLDRVNVYIDSPMAISTTEVFKRNAAVFDEETKQYILSGDNPLDFKNLRFSKTTEESMALNEDPSPKIIISASGMCDAGRIRHHLKHNLWNHKNSIVFVGYQAMGTLGRRIIEGERDLSILGEEIHVGARIYSLEGFSGHADQEGLLAWLSGFQVKPKQIFLVHGEGDAKSDFAALVKEKLGYDCTILEEVTTYPLDGEAHSLKKSERAEDDFVEEEQLEQMQKKLRDIHDNLEEILYHTNLALGLQGSPDKVIAINNILQELERDTLNLGTAVTKEALGD
jgi:metallo-beta-lactamase family protein